MRPLGNTLRAAWSRCTIRYSWSMTYTCPVDALLWRRVRGMWSPFDSAGCSIVEPLRNGQGQQRQKTGILKGEIRISGKRSASFASFRGSFVEDAGPWLSNAEGERGKRKTRGRLLICRVDSEGREESLVNATIDRRKRGVGGGRGPASADLPGACSLMPGRSGVRRPKAPG